MSKSVKSPKPIDDPSRRPQLNWILLSAILSELFNDDPAFKKRYLERLRITLSTIADPLMHDALAQTINLLVRAGRDRKPTI
jgi:hypothetical protein